MELTMKKMLVGACVASAMASGAHAATKYSEMTANKLTVTTKLDGAACAAGSVRSNARGGERDIAPSAVVVSSGVGDRERVGDARAGVARG